MDRHRIISSAAKADSTHLTTLGFVSNDDGTGRPIYGAGTTLGLFNGYNPPAASVLVKYTYYGDANLDGRVDGSDYTRIDFGYSNHLSGWSNGDFNYDGVVDGSDYTLIDNAFNNQGAGLANAAAIPASVAVTPSSPPPTAATTQTAKPAPVASSAPKPAPSVNLSSPARVKRAVLTTIVPNCIRRAGPTTVYFTQRTANHF